MATVEMSGPDPGSNAEFSKPRVGESDSTFRARTGQRPQLKIVEAIRPELELEPAAPDLQASTETESTQVGNSAEPEAIAEVQATPETVAPESAVESDAAAAPEPQATEVEAATSEAAAPESPTEPDRKASVIPGRVRGPELRSREDIIKPNDQFRQDYIEAREYIDDGGQEKLDDLHEATRQVGAAREHQEDLAERPVNERIIDKAKLVDLARERVGTLKEGQMAAHAEAKAVKTAALEKVVGGRDQATAEYSRIDHVIEGLTGEDGHPTGHVEVKFTGDDKVDLGLAKEVEALVAKGDAPIEESDYRDGELSVRRLSYAGSGNMTIVERWDSGTGRLLALDVVKSRGPTTQTKASTEATTPIAFLRGQFRELFGRQGDLVVLSPEISGQLGSLQKPEATPENPQTPAETKPQSLSAAEGHQHYIDNLSFLGSSEAYIDQVKRKRPAKRSFFAALLGDFDRLNRR